MFKLLRLFRGKYSVYYKIGTKHTEKVCGRHPLLLFGKAGCTEKPLCFKDVSEHICNLQKLLSVNGH